MLLKSNKFVLVCLLAALCLSVEARRRSRIDLPAKNATDTTTEENIATAASEKIEAAEKLDATTLATFLTEVTEEEKKPVESNSSEESPAYEDCDLDNISFEMITG